MTVDLRLIRLVLVDPEPDDRCNVLAMAVIEGGHRVALMVNAN